MAKPSVKQKGNKSNIFVRAINKFSNLHAPAKVLVLAIVIGGFAGGSYSVYMSSAAGWTNLGEASYGYNYLVKYNYYACKKSVPKRGYMVKSYAVITNTIGSQPAGTYYQFKNNISNKYFGESIKYNSQVKKGQTLTSPYLGYGSLSSYAKFGLTEQGGGGNSSTKKIGDLSTCP